MNAYLQALADQSASEFTARARECGITLDTETVRWLARDVVNFTTAVAAGDPKLTDRERHVMECIAEWYGVVLGTAAHDDEYVNRLAASRGHT